MSHFAPIQRAHGTDTSKSAITFRFRRLTNLYLALAIRNMLRMSPMFLQQLASRLRAARAAADVTQEQAAEAVGASTSSIANYEHGTTEVSASTLHALAAFYGVSADWLLSGARMSHRA